MVHIFNLSIWDCRQDNHEFEGEPELQNIYLKKYTILIKPICVTIFVVSILMPQTRQGHFLLAA